MSQAWPLKPIERVGPGYEVFVPGVPRPGGSKTAKVIRRRDGSIVTTETGHPIVSMRDDAKGNAEWKQQVAFFAQKARTGGLLIGCLMASVTFVMPRPKGHFGTGKNAGRLKPDAPSRPTMKPDTTKLWRSTEDALRGVLFTDDAQIGPQEIDRIYGEPPGAHIFVGQIRS